MLLSIVFFTTFSHVKGTCRSCSVDFTNFDFNILIRGTPYECATVDCNSDKLNGDVAHITTMRFSGNINTTFLSNVVKKSPYAFYVEIKKSSSFDQRIWIDVCKWRNLTRLMVFFNSVKTLKSRFLFNCPDLYYLDLSNNMITDIASDAFENLTKLNFLGLNSNQLKTLHPNTFQSTTKLKALSLNANQLEILHTDTFYNLKDMKRLYLEENHLKMLHKDLFKSFIKLDNLYLGINQLQSNSSVIIDQYSSLFPNICQINFNYRVLIKRNCYR